MCRLQSVPNTGGLRDAEPGEARLERTAVTRPPRLYLVPDTGSRYKPGTGRRRTAAGTHSWFTLSTAAAAFVAAGLLSAFGYVPRSVTIGGEITASGAAASSGAAIGAAPAGLPSQLGSTFTVPEAAVSAARTKYGSETNEA